jgi:hypothetical protein
MAFKLAAPIEKEFKLEETDAAYANEGDEATTVIIRQATQAQHERRSRLWSELKQEVFGDRVNPDSVLLIQNINFAELYRVEASLTLVGCNIEDEEGIPLFKFKDGKLKMSESDFKTAWGKLPPLVANEIRDKIVEVNITWGLRGEE